MAPEEYRRQYCSMRLVNPWAWFTSEMRREQLDARDRRAKRRAKALDHPFRFVVFAAVFWGGFMWVAVWRTVDVEFLIVLAVISLWFGFSMLRQAQRAQRKLTRENGPSNLPPPSTT